MLVKVHNDNVFDYQEDYRGRKITIPAKSSIEMEYDDAIQFQGTWTAARKDGNGAPLREFFKMIRVEEPPLAQQGVKQDPLMCIACRYMGKDAKDLQGHVIEAHAHQQAHDEDAEREMSRKKAK